MKRLIVLLIFLSCYTTTFARGNDPDSARVLLNSALETARTSDKQVLVMFRASWCSWCKRLEKTFESSEIHKIIDDHFVVVRLNVLERGEKVQSLENPGAREVMRNFGGETSGLPFLAFLGTKGVMLANSNVMPDKQNIGYPGSKEEITAFVSLLKKAAPRMTADQQAAISAYLTRNAPQ